MRNLNSFAYAAIIAVAFVFTSCDSKAKKENEIAKEKVEKPENYRKTFNELEGETRDLNNFTEVYDRLIIPNFKAKKYKVTKDSLFYVVTNKGAYVGSYFVDHKEGSSLEIYSMKGQYYVNLYLYTKEDLKLGRCINEYEKLRANSDLRWKEFQYDDQYIEKMVINEIFMSGTANIEDGEFYNKPIDYFDVEYVVDTKVLGGMLENKLTYWKNGFRWRKLTGNDNCEIGTQVRESDIKSLRDEISNDLKGLIEFELSKIGSFNGGRPPKSR